MSNKTKNNVLLCLFYMALIRYGMLLERHMTRNT